MKVSKFLLSTFVFSISLNASASLIASYEFNGNANDSSGNGYHGTVNGAVLTTDRFGNPNQAYYFDGINDYISINDDPAFSVHANGSFSISAWINVNAFNTSNGATRQPIISKGNTGDWEWAMYTYDDGTAGSSTWQTAGAGHSEIQGGNISLNSWHHVAVSFIDNVSNQVYLDGILVSSSNSFSGLANDGSTPIWIGGRQDGEYLNAMIDDVTLYSHALSSVEIQNLANDVSQVPAPTAVWLFGSGLIGLIGTRKKSVKLTGKYA